MYIQKTENIVVFPELTCLQDPCYPEGATNAKNDGPNPGTDDPIGPNPGEDCTDPKRANGLFSFGGTFPNYIGAAWCGGDATWRINYAVYYVFVEPPFQGPLSLSQQYLGTMALALRGTNTIGKARLLSSRRIPRVATRFTVM
jgi:hypothetical protein